MLFLRQRIQGKVEAPSPVRALASKTGRGEDNCWSQTAYHSPVSTPSLVMTAEGKVFRLRLSRTKLETIGIKQIWCPIRRLTFVPRRCGSSRSCVAACTF
jgi:hypothetical protein